MEQVEHVLTVEAARYSTIAGKNKDHERRIKNAKYRAGRTVLREYS